MGRFRRQFAGLLPSVDTRELFKLSVRSVGCSQEDSNLRENRIHVNCHGKSNRCVCNRVGDHCSNLKAGKEGIVCLVNH